MFKAYDNQCMHVHDTLDLWGTMTWGSLAACGAGMMYGCSYSYSYHEQEYHY